jgi:hypothetical protein
VYQRCCPTDCGGTRCFPSEKVQGCSFAIWITLNMSEFKLIL